MKIKFIIKTSLFFLALIFCTLQTWAGNSTVSIQVPLVEQENATLSDDYYGIPNDPAAPLYAVNRDATVRLIYDRDQGTEVGGADWELYVKYTLKHVDTNIDEEGELTISNTAGKGIYEALNLHSDPDMSGSVTITVDEVVATNGTLLPFPGDIRLELGIQTEHYDFVSENDNTIIGGPGTPTNGMIAINWLTEVERAEEFELQWVFVDDETIDKLADPIGNDRTALFKNASNIIVNEPTFNFTMAYPVGKLYFQVRPIGRFIRGVGTDYSHRKYGKWSNNVHVVDCAGFEDQKNWQYSITYAENGKNKKIINYFDDGLRSRQSQTNLSTEGLTLVAENIYDTEGRAAVNFLPVPKEENDLFFNPGFNRHSVDEPYSAKHFDKSNSSTPAALPASNDYGAAKYFSENNNFDGIHKDYIPSAKGFPFNQVELTHDGTGRIRYQGGIGKNYQIYDGSNQLAAHATRYYYGSATETELRRMFGSNIGVAAYYRKNLVVDPNGQVSVAYTDQTGQTVATALAGDNPDNVLPLVDGQGPGAVVLDLYANNVISVDDKTSRAVTTLLSTAVAQDYTFTYDLATGIDNVVALGNTTISYCASCKYDLEIWVSDSENNRLPLTVLPFQGQTFGDYDAADRKITYRYEPNAPCSGSTFSGETIHFETEFPVIGEYTVFKELRLVTNTVEDRLELFDQNDLDALYQTIRDEVEGQYADSEMCFFTCEQLCANNQDPDCLANCYADGEFDSEEIATGEPLGCEGILINIIAQVGPDGFYHDNDAFLANRAPTLLGYNCNTCNTDQAKATWVRDNWQESWGALYAQDHREYCHYLWCTEPTTIASDEHDLRMSRAVTHWNAEGISNHWTQAGLLPTPGKPQYYVLNNIAATLDLDPYFLDLAHQDARTHMVGFMSDVGEVTPCLQGQATTVNIFQLVTCNAFYPDNVADQDEMWANYMAIYNGFKKKAQALELEEDLGCDYQDDENAIVTKPFIPELSGTSVTVDDFYTNGIGDLAEHCSTTCDGRLDYWLFKLSENCSALENDPVAQNEIRTHLEQFCIASCMDLSNPFGYIAIEMLADPNMQANYPSLYAVSQILANLAQSCTNCPASDENCPDCTFETYDADGIPSCNPLSLDVIATEIYYQPVTADNFTPSCELCDVLAGFIDQGSWLETVDSDGTVLGTTWVPGDWNVTAIQAYFGESNLSPVAIAAAIANCTGNEAFSFMLDGDYNMTYDTGEEVAGVEAFLLNFLGCEPGEDYGNPIPGSGSGSNSRAKAPSPTKGPTPSQPTYCVCEKVAPYVTLNPAAFDVAQFNIDYNVDLTESQAFELFGELEVGKACYDLIIDNPFITSNVPTFPAAAVPCEFNPMLPVDFNFPDLAPADWLTVAQEKCEEEKEVAIDAETQTIFDATIDELMTTYLNSLIYNCFDVPFEEEFSVSFLSQEHHYTLYYYDQAGNLTQTVPPQGVALMDLPDGKYTGGDPEHKMKTRYRYNSLGQIIWQYSPDGGETNFYYDDIQRLRLSQNAQQAIDGTYSYTRYDAQSRIEEVGQVKPSSGFDPQVEAVKLTGFLSDPNFDYEDVTYTKYDKATNATFTQSNLRGRVAQTSNDAIVTSYDYDIHGNVRKLEHNVIDVMTAEIEYDYDLISGNVKEVIYQKGKDDEFRHRYEYDADNRLTNVKTSDKGYIWDQDARYFYYQHGPLARAEIGHDKVQGLDYFYTLQGWIKGVNMLGSVEEQHDHDPGRDGSLTNSNLDNSLFGRDQMAYYIGYNTEDYTPIGNVNWSPEMGQGSNLGSMYNNVVLGDGLYNGNIGLMATYIPALADKNIADSEIKSFGYQYDQLHRIRAAKSTYFNRSKTKWGYDKAYDTNYTYDANGNILSLNRNAAGTLIDELTYNYDYLQNTTEKNQLLKVIDTAPTNSLGYGDLQTQAGIQGDNYRYDAIGNLTRDWSEKIQNIEWSVYGKVKGVEYINTGQAPDNINFTYDATGNRLSKHIEDEENKTTYYLRDASGNIMATYKKTQKVVDQFLLFELKQEEVALYGSSRIGINKFADKVIESSVEINPDWEPTGPVLTTGFKLLHLYEDLRISELQYDSPLTEAGTEEEDEHLGEYITLYNRGEVPLSLEGVELRSGLDPYVKHLFDASTTLEPKQSLIVAYGTAKDKATFLKLNGLGEEIEQPDINWYWQTDLPLYDQGDLIVLKKVQAPFAGAVEGLEITLDLVEYGNKAENSYDNEQFDPSSKGPDLRSTINALTRKSAALEPTRLESRKSDEEYRISVFLEGLNRYPQLQQDEVYEQVVNSTNFGFETSLSQGTHTEKGNNLLSFDSDFKRERGDKLFELSNHLGNVLATVSDKLVQQLNSSGKPAHYEATVVSASDYYPFGLQQYGRKLQPEGYRYGFNGKEQDSEWGSQVIQDYGFRIYNPSLGKFLSVDPLTASFPWYTPYQFAGNKPIWAVDLDGLEEFFVTRWYENDRLFSKVVLKIVSTDPNDLSKGTHARYGRFGNRKDSRVQYTTTDRQGKTTITYAKELSSYELKVFKSVTADKWRSSENGRTLMEGDYEFTASTRSPIPIKKEFPPSTAPNTTTKAKLPSASSPEKPKNTPPVEFILKTENVTGNSNMCLACFVGVFDDHYESGIERTALRLLETDGILTIRPDAFNRIREGSFYYSGWDSSIGYNQFSDDKYDSRTYMQRILDRFEIVKADILKAGGGGIRPDQIKLEKGNFIGDKLDMKIQYKTYEYER